MTTNKQYRDSEGDFSAWRDHPQPCNQLVPESKTPCGAKVQVRTWESHDGAYEDYQYRCASGHTFWIDGIDS